MGGWIKRGACALALGGLTLAAAPDTAEARKAVRRTNRHANATRAGGNAAKRLRKYSSKSKVAQRLGANPAKVQRAVKISPLNLTYRAGRNIITTTLIDVDSHANGPESTSRGVKFVVHDYIGRPSAWAQFKFNFFGPIVQQKRLVECALDAKSARFGLKVNPEGGGQMTLKGGEKTVLSFVLQPGAKSGALGLNVENKGMVTIKDCRITPVAN